ncbi:uncharacterized protein LOC141645836 [Silene latifolia]|uniref:uncharacterized protein LOC141645836 n=1 Tax=Silene latifolia TaxID=37657 RepID=UPI003D77E682
MNGCLASVYKSFNALESEYFDPNLNKGSVFKPNTDVVVPLLSLNYLASSPIIYKCPTDDCCAVKSGLTCRVSGCSREMKFWTYAHMGVPSSSYKPPGFVKAAVRYMVMDNLEVNPMTVAFLKYHDIDLDKLEEKAVQVGAKEAVEILKASLTTDAVLTTVFMEKAN